MRPTHFARVGGQALVLVVRDGGLTLHEKASDALSMCPLDSRALLHGEVATIALARALVSGCSLPEDKDGAVVTLKV